MHYVVVSSVKKCAAEHGKRVGKDFLSVLDHHVHELVLKACEVRNGTKKTLDSTVAGFVGMKI